MYITLKKSRKKNNYDKKRKIDETENKCKKTNKVKSYCFKNPKTTDKRVINTTGQKIIQIFNIVP